MRVLVTRPAQQGRAFAAALAAQGALPIEAPTIALNAPDDPAAAARAIETAPENAWIVFTSANGVAAFFALGGAAERATLLGNAKVAAIGNATAQALREFEIAPDVVPSVHVGEAFAGALLRATEPGQAILIFRAQEARDVLPLELKQAGRRVSVVAGYKTVLLRDPAFAQKVAQADAIAFTSASTVRGFANNFASDAAAAASAHGKVVVCIGPITVETAQRHGINVDVSPRDYTTDALITSFGASSGATQLAVRFASSALLAAAIALFARKCGALTKDGAAAAWLVGICVFGCGGWPYAQVLFAFFLPSTLLSRLGRRRKAESAEIEKGGARDAAQVFANGGVAAACAVAAHMLRGTALEHRLSAAFASAFAAAASDTWGTEIGILSGSRPRDVFTFAPLAPGTSGGITFGGTLAEVAGALVVAVVASRARVGRSATVALCGFAGACVDSALGATLQELRCCPRCRRNCEVRVHRCGTPAKRIRGLPWMRNDAVNACATAAAALAAALLPRFGSDSGRLGFRPRCGRTSFPSTGRWCRRRRAPRRRRRAPECSSGPKRL